MPQNKSDLMRNVVYESGSKKGIQPAHAPKLRLLLAALDSAQNYRRHGYPGVSVALLAGKHEKQMVYFRKRKLASYI